MGALPDLFKVPFKRKAWGLRPKSHMILIEIKKEVCYLKKNSKTPQEKTAKIYLSMAFGPIISCFSVERDFRIRTFHEFSWDLLFIFKLQESTSGIKVHTTKVYSIGCVNLKISVGLFTREEFTHIQKSWVFWKLQIANNRPISIKLMFQKS